MIRLVAGFLLLMQLQPLVAAFTCMPAPHAEQEECMPPDQQAQVPAAGLVLTTHAESCPTIGLCAVSTIAVLGHTDSFAVVSLEQSGSGLAGFATVPQAPHAPPFHPPRV